MNLAQTIEAARNVLRFKHMAVKTEKSYVHWIARFAHWCKDHPAGDHADKVRGFLTHLAREKDVSASTQNQALNAIVFLYRHVLNDDVGNFAGFHPARQPRRLPTVLSKDEVAALLGHLSGMHWMIGALLYGSGLRLAECLSLRVKDVDFDRHIITVRDGKGAKDRAVMLPSSRALHCRRHYQDLSEITVSKQHPNIKALRAFNRWRRGGSGQQPAPAEVGKVIDWAITVCEAADRLINAKGKHAETAYGRLEDAVNEVAP